MRALTIPPSDRSSRPFPVPQSRFRVFRPGLLALIVSITLGLSLPAASAKADLPPGDLTTITGVLAAIKYVDDLAAKGEDPILIEQMRQLLLLMLWKLGGNPWELDPDWVIPLP